VVLCTLFLSLACPRTPTYIPFSDAMHFLGQAKTVDMLTDTTLTNTTATRLPSNLWQTTRECMHLVRRGHFQLRDKDGGDTIQSTIAEHCMLHADCMSLFYRTQVIAGIEIFDLLCSCDLDLDPTTFIYLYALQIYRTCENELPTSRLSNDIV